MNNDLISRAALAEELSSLSMTIVGLRAGKGVLREFMTEYRKSVLRIVDEAPSVDVEPANMMLEADRMRWISVKDRLPENEETVLISAVRKCANGKHWNVVMTAFYTDGKLHTEESSFAWDCECVEMEYCEETDDYIIPEGWWEAVECGDEFSAVDLFVTHWMPLPEPPKEW